MCFPRILLKLNAVGHSPALAIVHEELHSSPDSHLQQTENVWLLSIRLGITSEYSTQKS